MEAFNKAAFFDFDGTLTFSDTMMPFMVATIGWPKFLLAVVRAFPLLFGRLIHVCSTRRAKEALFAACFKGMEYEAFLRAGSTFAHDNLQTTLRPDILKELDGFLRGGNCKVAIVSASMEEWVAPFLGSRSIHYITTRPEIGVDGCLTGRFSSANCKGEEKVRRIKEAFPDIENCELHAFGNSSGDNAMLALATYPHWVK